MHFKFQQLCPHVFQDQPMKSSIWNTDFEILKGERVLIHAISGKGKTSFIYYSLGLRNDYTGSLLINNQEVSQISTKEWTEMRRSCISTVFQDLQLFENLSVRENIALLPEFAKGFTLNDAMEMLKFLNISDKWDQKVKTLSFGQKQRVAIIRALMKPFDVLICDEPFSHLDRQNTIKCSELIERRLKEENAGLIISALEEDCSFSELKTIHL